MASKTKTSDTKTPILKGKQAEDKVLDYMKRMNRPFGAVDVSANLKGAVPKTAAQKILVTLAERGDLVQKTCGKMTFFVANQANMDDIPADRLGALESELRGIEGGSKTLAAEARTFTAEIASLKSAPTDSELNHEISKLAAAIEKVRAHLEPLRAGAPLISKEEIAQLDDEWTKWRREWVRRRKIFNTFWSLATDTLTPQQSNEMGEDLGIEIDTPEHVLVERGPLCVLTIGSVLGKRRR